MARETTQSGTGVGFESTSFAALTGSPPMTLAVWFNISSLNTAYMMQAKDNGNTYHMSIAINATPNLQMFWKDSTGTDARNLTTLTFSTATWYPTVYVATSTSLRDIYARDTDGTVYTVQDTTARTTFTADTTSIGCAGIAAEFSGYIAEAAFWQGALNLGEIYAYLAGYSPLMIRPDILNGYYQLQEHDATDDALAVIGSDLPRTSGENASYAPHPPNIIYPAPIQYGISAGAAPAQVIGPFPTFIH